MPMQRDAAPAFPASSSGLVKQYDGVRAVDDVSLTVGQGEIFALLGSSGSGKSTLLRMLAGFEAPDAGSIMLDGQDILAVPPYERPINMMFQSYALFPHLRAWDNVAFGLRRAGLPKDRGGRAGRAVAGAGPAGRLRQAQAAPAVGRPAAAGGAGAQPGASARSCCCSTSRSARSTGSCANSTQVELVNIIEQVGVTCMMVTHDQDEAMSMATRIAVMNEGRILQVGHAGRNLRHARTAASSPTSSAASTCSRAGGGRRAGHAVVESPECRHCLGQASAPLCGRRGAPRENRAAPDRRRCRCNACRA